MKKIFIKTISTALSLIMVLTMIPVFTVAYAQESDFTFEVHDEHAVLVSYIGSDAVVEIPSTYQEKPVTEIGWNAFSLNNVITQVTVPEGVLTINTCAFEGCENLEKVVLPSSLQKICYNAFNCCMALKDINTPENVEDIEPQAFFSTWYYNNLENWIDGVLYIGNWAIYVNGDVPATLEIKDGTTNIAGGAFDSNPFVKSITLPDSVKYISSSAFRGADNLETLNLGEGLITLNDYSIYNNRQLKSLHIPKTTKTITELAMGYLEGLESITVDEENTNYYSGGNCLIETSTDLLILGCKNSEIPNTVKTIGASAFNGINVSFNINIPDGVKTIKRNAFFASGGLTEIHLPKTTSIIEGPLFNFCDNLRSITVDPENEWYYASGNCIISREDDMLLSACNNTIVPEGVKIIGYEVFRGLNKITSITLPSTVKEIRGLAFSHCENLQKVTLNEGLETLGESAFFELPKLKSLTLPTTIKNIGYCAISYATEKVVYPGTKAAFEENVNCSSDNSDLFRVLVYQPKTVKLSTTLYTYNGKVKKPSVIVKTASGKTVSTKNYSYKLKTSGKYVGKHKITVTFKGDYYSGTKNLYFTIKPGATSVKKLTPYQKSIKVYLNKKTTQTSGYQIEWSTSKKFTNSKKALIKSNKTTSYTIKSLSRKKTYYVRVRTYKTVNGERIYSSYSSYKYTKTK